VQTNPDDGQNFQDGQNSTSSEEERAMAITGPGLGELLGYNNVVWTYFDDEIGTFGENFFFESVNLVQIPPTPEVPEPGYMLFKVLEGETGTGVIAIFAAEENVHLIARIYPWNDVVVHAFPSFDRPEGEGVFIFCQNGTADIENCLNNAQGFDGSSILRHSNTPFPTTAHSSDNSQLVITDPLAASAWMSYIEQGIPPANESSHLRTDQQPVIALDKIERAINLIQNH